MSRRDPTVRASELSLYGFCRQAWWLGAVEKVPSAHREALARGTTDHQTHARTLRQAVRYRWVGLAFLILGTLAALAWLLLALAR